MPLPNFKSLCGKKQKIIVSRDAGNPQQHIAVNESGCIVSQYKIDGDVIRDDERCDYLVWNEDKKNIYLIELKGSDLNHAVEQLENTEKILNNRFFDYLKECTTYYRIVLNRVITHQLHSNYVKKFEKTRPNRLLIKTKVLEENI